MATASNARRNFPTFRKLAAPIRWFFSSRRRVLIAAMILLATIAVLPIWWSIQLLGLPDIGPPFDAAEFRAFRIPDDRNAFVIYRQAAARLRPMDTSGRPKDERIDQKARWSKADPLVRRWLEENRSALDLFRKGTERPDALPPDGPLSPRDPEFQQALRSFGLLALVEASRLEDAGDMAGAWGWYRAALRSASHVGMHGPLIDRLSSQFFRGEIHERLQDWALDHRTTPAVLRRALDDTIADAALAPNDADTIRADYDQTEKFVTDRRGPGRYMLAFRIKYVILGSARYQILDDETAEAIADAWRRWRRDEERSRRVIRLVVANWLAYQTLPTGRRPPPSPDTSGVFDFYAFGPEAPANARALSPAALDRWLLTTWDALEILRARDYRSVRARERAVHREMVILLASQLYRRDHGTYPPSEQDLVGPYLKELPDDGMGDPSDAIMDDPAPAQDGPR